MLNQEIQKCATFTLRQFEDLQLSLNRVESHAVKVTDVAAETLETFHFIVTNICTLRQIILRFNSFRRIVDATLIDESDIPMARKLFEMEPLAQMEVDISLYQVNEEVKESLTHFSQQYNEFRQILVSSLQSVERAGGGNMVIKDRILSSGRQFLIKGSSKQGLLFEPSLLNQKGRNLKKEIRTLAKWRGTKVLASKQSLEPSNVWPLVLNLISCFLFMMNNYIIEPSSAYYVNALGTSDAVSGLLIGVSAWSALISAVGYSFWTNYSYKRPIVFAGTLMIIGNLMYSNAYSYQSIYMCLLGRAICGLGAPRVINRRYVADATPFSLRTRSSAAFALMTALGAAVGPGAAILLEMFDFEFQLPVLGKQHFNGMTGPGYVMSFAWSIYTILVLMTFQEPKRSGLAELCLREDFPATWGEDDHADDDDESLDTEKLDRNLSIADQPSLNSPSYCVKHMSKAAFLFMVITFLKRITLETIVGSISIVSKNRYQWTISNVGTLHLASGLLVIPLSIMSGWISQYMEDMYAGMWLNLIAIFGLFVLVDVTDFIYHSNDTYNSHQVLSVGAVRYIIGTLIAFSGIEGSESFVASLMSKAVPSKLAVGTFNSALLLTLVGTSGRAMGDLLISAMAFISVRNLLNLLILPCLGLMLTCRFLAQRYRNVLAG